MKLSEMPSISVISYIIQNRSAELHSLAIPETWSFRNTARKSHVSAPTVIQEKTAFKSPSVIRAHMNGTGRVQQQQPHRREPRDIPSALSLAHISQMIPTNKMESPVQNYIPIIPMTIAILVLLESETFHTLHSISTGMESQDFKHYHSIQKCFKRLNKNLRAEEKQKKQITEPNNWHYCAGKGKNTATKMQNSGEETKQRDTG